MIVYVHLVCIITGADRLEARSQQAEESGDGQDDGTSSRSETSRAVRDRGEAAT